MFNQFRIHYPKGSLVTELSAIDHGQYIVRCLVQVEGTTLVTALAAAQTVELAEEQARSRALAVLGIDLTNAPGEQELPHTPREIPQPPTATPITPVAFSSESRHESPPIRLPELSLAEETSSFSSLESKQEQVPDRLVTAARVADEMTFSNIPSTTATTVTSSIDEENSLWTTDKPPSLGQLNEVSVVSSPPTQLQMEKETSRVTPPDTPIDFSDIIARTNVELKRLGWNTQQGKDYLLQTYGKRSRQLLTDDELQDFLFHLESLPTPE